MNVKALLGAAALTLMVAASNASASTPIIEPVYAVPGPSDGWTVICRGYQCADMFARDTYSLELDDIVMFWGDPPEPPATDVPDSPLTNTNALCSSDVDDRRNHANEDLRWFQIARNSPVQGPVEITYDDGGTEVWMAIGAMSSTVIQLAPVANSLTCP